jgi:DNA (cytosine-5)-methyltransferase 1
VIVFENSPYLKAGENGTWFLRIEKEIKKAGYWFREANAQEIDCYDVSDLPQKRNRLFMVAFSIKHFKNGKFNFPKGEKISAPKELSAYVDFNEQKDGSYYLAEDNRYFDLIKGHESDGNCLYQLRKYLVRTKEANTCPTLTANMGQGGHNVPFIIQNNKIRKLTEYECVRLQGFPTSFEFPDSVPRGARYVQAGNAVAVPVAELLGKQVYEKIISERR